MSDHHDEIADEDEKDVKEQGVHKDGSPDSADCKDHDPSSRPRMPMDEISTSAGPAAPRGRRRESIVLLQARNDVADLAGAAESTQATLNDLEALLASLKSSSVLAPQPLTPRCPAAAGQEEEAEEQEEVEASGGMQGLQTNRPKKERTKSRYMDVSRWDLKVGCSQRRSVGAVRPRLPSDTGCSEVSCLG